MRIIKAAKCEVEFQEQTNPDAAAKYMIVLSYEPEDKKSKEIISVVMTNTAPFIKYTKDLGDKIVEETIAEKIYHSRNNVHNQSKNAKDN